MSECLFIFSIRAQAGEELSAEDQYRIRWFTDETLDKFSYVFGEYRRGMIDTEDMAVTVWRQIFYRDIPGMLDFWEAQKSTYSPDFVLYIEENVIAPGWSE